MGVFIDISGGEGAQSDAIIINSYDVSRYMGIQSWFNYPVNINTQFSNNCNGMFNNLRYFNQPVTIPNSVANCRYMFWNCYNLNQPVTIPNSVTDCTDMFMECYNFNQPVTVPNSVTNCGRMFSNCYNMRSLVRLPEKFNNGRTTAFWTGCPVSVENGTLQFY